MNLVSTRRRETMKSTKTTKGSRQTSASRAGTRRATTCGHVPKLASTEPAPKSKASVQTKASAVAHVSKRGDAVAVAAKPSKLALIIGLLRRAAGATLPELVAITGWQAHSVRGALAGALRHRGIIVESTKTNGIRRYRITETDTAGHGVPIVELTQLT
jgi:hypothetical protein